MPSIFAATRAFEREYDALFDFVGATAAAIWNMRWQVRGYSEAHPDAPESQLLGHFIAGTQIGNFKFSYFTDVDWSQQEEQVARTALVNVISLYERWLEGVEPLRMISQRKRLVRSDLRAYAEAIPKAADPAFLSAATEIRRLAEDQGSQVMKEAYAGSLARIPAHEGGDLSALLTYYRFLKEMRNQFMHRDLIPDSRLIDAYNASTSVSYSRLKGAGLTALTVTASSVPHLDLRTAFFACHVVRSLVRTFDLELGETTGAEDEIVHGCLAAGSPSLNWRGSKLKTVASMRRLLASLKYPRPVGGLPLYERLVDEGAIRIIY